MLNQVFQKSEFGFSYFFLIYLWGALTVLHVHLGVSLADLSCRWTINWEKIKVVFGVQFNYKRYTYREAL